MSITAKSFNHAGLDGLLMMEWAGKLERIWEMFSVARRASSIRPTW